MDKLKQILKDRNISFNGNLEAKVKEYKFDPKALTDEDCAAIADELAAESAALTVAPKGNGKPDKPVAQQPPAKPDATLEDIKLALLQDLERHKTNLGAFQNRYLQHRNSYNRQWVSEMVRISDTTESDALNELRDHLMSKEADPESFSGAADALLAELELAKQPNAAA